MQQLIAQCDLNIERQLAAIADRTNPSQDSEPTLQLQDWRVASHAKESPNGLELSLAGHLKRILGVDLTTIPGLNVLAVLNLLSETGTNMAKWRTEKVGSGC